MNVWTEGLIALSLACVGIVLLLISIRYYVKAGQKAEAAAEAVRNVDRRMRRLLIKSKLEEHAQWLDQLWRQRPLPMATVADLISYRHAVEVALSELEVWAKENLGPEQAQRLTQRTGSGTGDALEARLDVVREKLAEMLVELGGIE